LENKITTLNTVSKNILSIKKWLRNHFELLSWIIALVILFLLPAENAGNSLCLFRFLGFAHCPGCGIGHSIRNALHGELMNSFKQHPLGIIAVFVIFNRIKQLLPTSKQPHEA